MDIFVNLAEILSAVGTVGALFFIANQTKQANNALEHTQNMLSIEQERELRAVEDQARQQATGIVSWPAILTPEQGKQSWGLIVDNRTSAPVFSLQVLREAGETNKGVQIARVAKQIAILPPGRYFVSDRKDDGFPTLLKDDVTEPILKNSGYLASLTFTDSNGKTWMRDARGSLSPLESPAKAA
ncbi:hypothetical protein [Arthrobacter sp. zg-Y1110]|uniref:hypothetical protein n=1 Tax=Arthrobacter sp. zg-Y1110 TaxID=2886932 RepID=UPI001D14147C|nr:hypothetical protein [Arthrobacter sp. zg-Y1110]MCC3291769.1 hypothetical protein [Arthrobacter sp. zg-Y1110]UWX85604.1 hypothetical protein N2K99_03355 [Arthrobacter sp. zg-Y1110]